MHYFYKIINFIIRNSGDISLETKYLRISIVLAVVFNIFSLILGMFTQQNTVINILGVVSTSLTVVLFFISLSKVKYEIIFYSLFLLSFGYVLLAWKYYNGIVGSSLILLLVFSCFYSLLSKGFHSYVVLIASLVLFFLMAFLEYNNPQIITPYRNRDAAYADMVFTGVISIFLTFIFVKHIFNRYLRKLTVEIQNSLLIEKNQLISDQNVQLMELNNTKDKFFSIIAHDLISPFSGFIGLSRMMAQNTNDFTLAEIQNLSSKLYESAGNLYDLLLNLLEWSRVQRGMIEFNKSSVNVFEITSKVIETQANVSQQKRILIKNMVNKDLFINADPKMLHSILRNIISNAIKFSFRDSFVLITSDYSISENKATISVKDSGIGMSDELKNKLFKLDEIVSRPGTEQENSTGLGLILCKEFVDKHNGKILIESTEGSGSCFHLSLPIA